MDHLSETPEAKTAYLLKRIARQYLFRFRGIIALSVVCMLVVAGSQAANAWLLQPVLDEIFLKKDQQMLFLIPIALVGIALLGGIANYGQTVLLRKVGQGVIAKMQVDLFAHLINADVGLFQEHSSGRLISRFTNDLQLMRNAVSSVITGIAREVLTMIFLIGVMFYQSWELSLIAFVLFPLLVHPVLRMGRKMRRISDGTQEQLSVFAGQLDETFKAVRVVKAYGREDYEIARAKSTVHGLYKMYMKASRLQAMAAPMIEIFASAAIAGVIAYGGMEVIQGKTTAGAFFSFIAAMIMAYRPMRLIAGMSSQLQEGMSAARRFFAVLDEKPQVLQKDNALDLKITHGQVEIKNLSFYYGHNIPALTKVNIEVPAGKMLALVGASGAGKTTLMNLLLRFYDPDEGAIYIDGQDIKGLSFKSFRSQISFVSQEIMLFDDSIFANIAYGKENASVEEVEAAAKAADAHEFIIKLHDGYKTRVGNSGMKLSGGQRQRISIARAMLRNAPILLLDEATSALDNASERSVQKALDELMQKRTSIVIAHRLSTVRHADMIIVLDAGKVVESGTHEQLLTQAGKYASLYNSQFYSASPLKSY